LKLWDQTENYTLLPLREKNRQPIVLAWQPLYLATIPAWQCEQRGEYVVANHSNECHLSTLTPYPSQHRRATRRWFLPFFPTHARHLSMLSTKEQSKTWPFLQFLPRNRPLSSYFEKLARPHSCVGREKDKTPLEPNLSFHLRFPSLQIRNLYLGIC
jgi:hypothetical protein